MKRNLEIHENHDITLARLKYGMWEIRMFHLINNNETRSIWIVCVIKQIFLHNTS